jgi:hypothetical protein
MADVVITGLDSLTVTDPGAVITCEFDVSGAGAATLEGLEPPTVWWLNIHHEGDPITDNSTVWWQGVAISPGSDPALLRVLFKPSSHPSPLQIGDNQRIQYRPNSKTIRYAASGPLHPVNVAA